MSGRGKGERCSDDLTAGRKSHGLEDALQSIVTISEQSKVVDPQTLLEVCLELLMLNTHIGKPMAFPKRRDFFKVFLHRRHG